MPRNLPLPLTLTFLIATAARAGGPAYDASDFFERRVRPVLVDHCLACHGPKVAKGGLRLDSREGLMAGAESGPVVTPGEPEESPLVAAVRRAGPLKMPPKTALASAA